MGADRHLPLEALAGEAAVVGERMPERALGLGRIAAQEPREAAHRATLAGRAGLAILGEQGAQRGCLLAVEHAAARRPLAALGERDHDAVERLDVLLGRLHAREDVAQVDQHGRALVERAEIFDLVERALEIAEEGVDLLLGRRLRLLRHRKRKLAVGRELEPFVGRERHRLREIERGEGGVDRKGDDAVGERDLVVLQAIALAPEQDRDILARRDMRRQERRCLVGAEHGLGLVVGARGRRQHHGAVGDRVGDGLEQCDLIEDAVGPRRRAVGLDVRPAVARLHQPQPPQPEIGHAAGGRADVLPELRLDQDDDRAGGGNPVPGLVGSCAWHGLLRLTDITGVRPPQKAA